MAETQIVSERLEDAKASGKLDFFGETVCALKPAFREGYRAVAGEFRKRSGHSLRSYLPAVCGCDGVKGAENIHKIREIGDPAQMPDVIASLKFGDYFSSRFLSQFTGRGYFERLELPVHPVFKKSGLLDPNGEFFIFSVLPAVLMVDENRLGGRPAPRRWDDLLDPAFAGDVALPAEHGAVSTLLPLTVLRDHGGEGLDALSRAARGAMHSTDMIRSAGNGADGPAVYVISWFFAKACPHPGVRIVWPEDGALVEPMFLLVRQGRSETYRALLDFITGDKYGAAAAAHCYPSANPTVENHLPEGAVFNWLGWDFIRAEPLERRIADIKARFASLAV